MNIRIPKAIISDMLQHAYEQSPKECCGVLMRPTSSPGRVIEIRRTRNTHPDSTTRYTMDAKELSSIMRYAAESGYEILGFYHSHPRTMAQLSDVDLDEALNSDWSKEIYVVISLAEMTRPVVRAFSVERPNRRIEHTIETF